MSPLTSAAECGRIASAVSIRSGRGSMTHDRILRFVPVFTTHLEAARFATAQALAWIGRTAAAPIPSLKTSEAFSPWPKKT